MADLPLSSLTADEAATVAHLDRKIGRADKPLGLLEKYRDAEQRIEHIGLATPPELRRFEASINVPGMAVYEVTNRQELRAFVRTDSGGKPDEAFTAAMDQNNLATESTLVHKDCRSFGRAFVSVSSNADDPDMPLIRAEPTRSIGVDIDTYRRRITAALRRHDTDNGVRRRTLYTATSRIELERVGAVWKPIERDDHGFGKVPLVMFLNDASAGKFEGRSAMAAVIRKVDAIARTLTNMQVAAEVAAIPGNVIFGADAKDFQDQAGNPIPAWEAYWTKLKAFANEKGHIEQLAAADLKNFTHMVDRFLVWCAIELGLPTRYAGMDTTNPASEGAVVADEYRLVKRVERINVTDGDAWSWVMGLHEEFRTGEPVKHNSIRALWHNPATPTYSQRVDGVMKMRAAGLMSREGAWDELGWSEERKQREREYLASEADDPLMRAFGDLMGGARAATASNA